MAITELVILPLKPGKDLRAEVYEKLPSLMCTSFGISGGPRAMTLARILESTPADAEDHRGYAGVISMSEKPTPLPLSTKENIPKPRLC